MYQPTLEEMLMEAENLPYTMSEGERQAAEFEAEYQRMVLEEARLWDEDFDLMPSTIEAVVKAMEDIIAEAEDVKIAVDLQKEEHTVSQLLNIIRVAEASKKLFV